MKNEITCREFLRDDYDHSEEEGVQGYLSTDSRIFEKYSSTREGRVQTDAILEITY